MTEREKRLQEWEKLKKWLAKTGKTLYASVSMKKREEQNNEKN